MNYTASYSLIITALLVFRDRKTIRGVHSILAFVVCIFLYLIIESIDNFILHIIVIAGPLLLPFTFWLFSKSLFNDEVISAGKTAFYLIITLTSYYGFYLLDGFGYSKITSILSRMLSVFFVILALRESQLGKKIDLDEDRIKLRKYFIYFIGLIVLATLLVELSLNTVDQQYPRILQRASILVLNSLFITSNFSIKSKLLSNRKRPTEIQNPQLIESIQSMMVDEQFFRKEKLTISQLAEALNEQEYKVRRAINQDMGYRNFIDFTNSFRIRKATDMLKDETKSDLTILEIAYQTGFNSIGPFNRAFKLTTGLTPTDFRKKYQSK